MLSIIIPAYKEPYLHKTINSLLKNATGEIEVIAVLDGYWAKPEEIVDDKRVRYIHLGKTYGMREAINIGVRISRGEYIMRSDSHCIFGEGFDQILISQMEDNWIVTPRRYCLDPVKWEVMDIPPVDYEKIGIQTIGQSKKFTGFPWERPDRKDVMIDETMAMQGSCWLMKKSWWDKAIGELQTEGYGPHLQDSHEMVFKTWKAGGKLMINKNTWFAHKHVSFTRTHNYGGEKAENSVKYSYETWKDYYREIKEKWHDRTM